MNKPESLWETLYKRPYLIIAGIILIIFIISANLAWLNPNPNYVVKTNPKIPILWQYNGDATVEFLTAAYFPEYLKVDKTRTNRPGYPFIAHTLGEVYGLIALPFHPLGPLQKGLLGYMTMKLLVYLSAALTLYHIVRRWLPKEVALISVALVFFHPFSVIYSGTFHTSELQFITPIFLAGLWLNLADNYSHKKNIFYSLLVGVLMLAKQNYAAYLAILLFSFFIAKKYRESILSFVVHLIPLIIWLITLKLLHIPYYNHETISNGDGVWVVSALTSGNLFAFIQILVTTTKEWFIAISGYFTVSVFLALLALSFPELRSRLTRRHKIFIFILLGANWLQFLAARSYAGYLTSDLAIVIFPLAAYFIYRFFESRGLKKFVPAFLIFYLLVGVLTIAHFPWVHPYDQHDITHPDRVELLQEGKLVPRK